MRRKLKENKENKKINDKKAPKKHLITFSQFGAGVAKERQVKKGKEK